MAAVTVRIRGDKEVNRFLTRLPRKTQKEGEKLTKRIAQFIVRSAKQRVAPLKTGTGALMKSIMMNKSRNGYVVSAGRGLDRPYAFYQEYGFSGHYIHRDMIESGSRLRKLGRGKRNFFFVQKHTPFMEPAFRQALNRLDMELNKTANKIVR